MLLDLHLPLLWAYSPVCMYVCPITSVSQSVASCRAAAAAGVIHVSELWTLWLCGIVCNNTGKKEALI